MTSDVSWAQLDGAPRSLGRLVHELSQLPAVVAVALGGSRAAGTHSEESDWDLGVYYRGDFRPGDVRALGHPGTVVEIGAWGGGVFNGGAWLELDGTKVDLLWRDLDVVDHEIAEAQAGRWRLEPLMFHLTGVPSYILLAELARNRVLYGQLARPDYPVALRRVAGRDWARRAQLTLDYASTAHAAHGRLTSCLGMVAVGAAEFAHAAAATAGRWVTNDKNLLTEGGMGDIDRLVRALAPDPTPDELQALVAATIRLGRQAVADAGDT